MASMAHQQTLMADTGGIILPRCKIAPSIWYSTRRVTNKFSGAHNFLNPKSKNRKYINLPEIIDESYLLNEENVRNCHQLFTSKRNQTILNLDSVLVQVHGYKADIDTSPGAQHTLNNHMRQLERNLLKYLIDLKLWPDVAEMSVILCKCWMLACSVENKLGILDESFIFALCALKWEIIEVLIDQFVMNSLALRLQNSKLMHGTNFSDLKTLTRAVWLNGNIFADLCRFSLTYKPHNDIYSFILLLKHSNPMESNFECIKHYLQHAPVQYTEEPAKSKLLQLVSNDPCTRDEFRKILAFVTTHKHMNVSPRVFQNVFSVRDHHDGKWSPAGYVKDNNNNFSANNFELCDTNADSTPKINEWKWLRTCLYYNTVKKNLQDRVLDICKNKLKNRSAPVKIKFIKTTRLHQTL